jgi:DNA-binding IclR family transcriptional regulator
MFNLNLVGSRILELLKSGSTEPEIVDEIGQEFSVGRELAENDVHEFLQTLQKCHLVEHREAGVVV